MCAKTYQNRARFDKVIRKIIWCSFFCPTWYTVHDTGRLLGTNVTKNLTSNISIECRALLVRKATLKHSAIITTSCA